MRRSLLGYILLSLVYLSIALTASKHRAQTVSSLADGFVSFVKNCDQDCRLLSFNGKWRFSPGELKLPAEILSSPSQFKLINVPGTWNPTPFNPLHKDWKFAEGVGTYWLHLDQIPRSAF